MATLPLGTWPPEGALIRQPVNPTGRVNAPSTHVLPPSKVVCHPHFAASRSVSATTTWSGDFGSATT